MLIENIQEKVVLEKDVIGKSLAEFDRTQNYDLIFLGSSHCYRCFDPSVFQKYGLNTYNLGSSSQTPINSFSILNSVIKNTKAVLLEVYPVVSGLSGEESFLSMNASVDDYSLLLNNVWHLNDLRCYNALSFKPFIDSHNKKQSYNITKSYRGYVSRKDTVKPGTNYDNIIINQDYFTIQISYIKKIIYLCEVNKVKLAFVYAPVPPELKIDGENIFINMLNEIAAQKNIPFYDFGRDHHLKSKEHFFDDDHLNQAGVELFNIELLKTMKDSIN